ncbi:hypothetical protein NKG05_15775 [Oerskovia sp. M15]
MRALLADSGETQFSGMPESVVAGLDRCGRRFGEVLGYDGGPLPAPVLPDVRLKPRSRRRELWADAVTRWTTAYEI